MLLGAKNTAKYCTMGGGVSFCYLYVGLIEAIIERVASWQRCL